MGFFSAISREIHYVKNALRVLGAIKSVDSESNNLVCDDIEKIVDKFSKNLAFIEDDRTLTYAEFDAYANQVAHWALAESCQPGDTVAVFVRNRLEYVAIWHGLSKVGVIPALLNFQLAGPALSHCINISDAKCLILDHELAKQWTSAKKSVTVDIKTFAAFGKVKGHDSFDDVVASQSTDRPPRAHRDGIKAGDQFMKMFTSGTTGLPKAAKVSHVRAQNYLRGFAAGSNAGPKDRMLMVLPMYHATGGLCGVGCAISKGGAVIVRPKFSASKFWDEAVEFKATMFMYVGELCRFLLTCDETSNEKKHNIQWIIGNGLRPEVWPKYIPHVIEFYGATEGNVSLMNLDGDIGAVGRVPPYFKGKFNCDIIRFDVESGTNTRSSDGFCIRANNMEVGELIGEIRTDDPRFRFDGYETKEATQKKILRNVFKKDDAWFRTGDLMKRDVNGFYYFVDRIGDTYRWKAENVATGEVAAVLSSFAGVTQANVYGVRVPGYDGRAGMAAIVSEDDVNLKALKAHVEASLPHYARPVFLRISKESDTTSTFKFKKTNLVKAGFDPGNISDPLFVLEPKGEFIILDKQIFKRIESGDLRL